MKKECNNKEFVFDTDDLKIERKNKMYLSNNEIKTLEKYKKVFDNKLNILNEYEFNDIVTLDNVLTVIQRAEMVMKIVDEIKRKIYELGDDGRLVNMQLEELIGGLEKEELQLIKDYMVRDGNAENILEEFSNIGLEEIDTKKFITSCIINLLINLLYHDSVFIKRLFFYHLFVLPFLI